jgi:hypothetical protein
VASVTCSRVPTSHRLFKRASTLLTCLMDSAGLKHWITEGFFKLDAPLCGSHYGRVRMGSQVWIKGRGIPNLTRGVCVGGIPRGCRRPSLVGVPLVPGPPFSPEGGGSGLTALLYINGYQARAFTRSI